MKAALRSGEAASHPLQLIVTEAGSGSGYLGERWVRKRRVGGGDEVMWLNTCVRGD